jgi:uncharacterized membrane protein YfcA
VPHDFGLAAVRLTGARAALLVAAGFGAGVFNGVAGGGTLISFPALLALGYPALTANVTSTVGIWPGYLGSVAGFRTEIADQRARLRSLGAITVVGAIVGAVLLLTTPSHAFSKVAPWLVLFASALFALRPVLAKVLTRLGHTDGQVHRPLLFGGMFLAAVYGGYFGAAMGVIMLAVLGLALPDTLARSNGIRAVLSVVANGVAAIVFVVHGSLPWAAVGALALGCLIGGYAGAVLARRLPVPIMRVLVVCVGLATGIRLLVG